MKQQPEDYNDHTRYNEFRVADAIEFVSAWEMAGTMDADALRYELARLEAKFKFIEAGGGTVGSSHLAAYRAYEHMLLRRTTGQVLMTVKVFDEVKDGN